MKKLFFASAILCLLCIGCSKEKNLRAPLELFPTLKVASTKAVISQENIINEKIRVHVSMEDGVSQYGITNSKLLLSHSGSDWTLSESLYLSTDNAKIFAYAPSTSDPETLETGQYNSLKRNLDISASRKLSEQSDYLWCYQDKTTAGGSLNINNSNPGVTLEMKHGLAQIAFVFYKENYSGAGSISSFKIGDVSGSPQIRVNKADPNDLSMSTLDGSITGGQLVNELVITDIGKSITLDSNPGTDAEALKGLVDAYAFIVPMTKPAKSDIKFSFNVDSREYSVVLSGSGGISWVAGQQYIYTVKLTGTQISIQNVIVTPWTSSFEGDIVIN